MKRTLGIILTICMLLSILPTNVFAAATDILVTSAAYHNNGDVKSIDINFGWDTASATSKLTVMTERLRSAGEVGTNEDYGDFTDLGYYGKAFNSWDAVIAQADKFGMLYYTDEENMLEDRLNSLSLNFDKGDIPMNVDKTYYVYLWTYWRGQYYPDNLFMVLRMKDGQLQYAPAKDRNDYGSFTVLKDVSSNTPSDSDTPSTSNTPSTPNIPSSSNTQSDSNAPSTSNAPGSSTQSNSGVISKSAIYNEISVNEFEWEVLRLCNIERANEGLESMTMIQALQEGCNIREQEISTLFSHTRPNGEQPQSVIPAEYKWGYTAENIADGQRSAQRVVTEWMYSSGHRAAIMHKELGYMGVGFYKPTYSWVQLFAGRKNTVSFTVSTDKRVFSSKEEILSEYMTLTASNGVVSYLPLDFDSMVNNNGNYTPRISADNLPVFSLTAEAIENEKNKPDTSEKFENLSVNNYEWELLRLTNVERAKEGANSLSMPQSLQLTCDIREADLAEKYSHYRPDGTMYNGILSDEMMHRYTGENIAKGETPEAAMQNLLKQTTYCGNLLRQEFGYAGIGYTDNGGRWVQIFGTRENVIKCEVSTEQRVFSSKDEIKKHYLKLTDDRGIVSYLPLDFDSMKVSDGKYIPRINSKGINLPVFSIGDPASQPAENASVYTKFTDVKHDAYYASAVDWAVKKNITAGTSDTTFSPDNTCTRAQILTFMWRAVGSPKMSGANPFSDVKQSDYYYNAALWANSKGMVTGTTFAPATPCTRSATVVYLWQNAGKPSASYSGNFVDVNSTSAYAQAVAWAVNNGVTSGTSATTFSPDTTCTRGQIVTFLQRALK